MKSKAIILPTLLSALAVGSFISFHGAANADDMNMEDGGRSMSGEVMSGKQMGVFGLSTYLDVSTLSGDDLTTYESALTTYQDTMKSLRDETKANSGSTSTGDDTFKTSMTTAWTTFMNSIRSLVASDKLDAFDTFVAAGPQMGNFGSGDRQSMGSGNHMQFGSGDQNFGSGSKRDSNKSKKESTNTGTTSTSDSSQFKYIKGTTYTKIDTLLSALTTDQLNTLLTKIEALITNLDSSSSNYELKLEVYNELKIMIQNKLGVNTADDVSSEITDLLSE